MSKAMSRGFRIYISGDGAGQVGWFGHATSTRTLKPLTGYQHLARTWPTKAEAERFTVEVLKLRITDDPRPGETVACIAALEGV